MGIDIRDGSQLECINCGLCIDACDEVMIKIDRPTALIAYDTDAAVEARAAGRPALYRLVRPRTVFYALALVAVSALMVWGLSTRTTLDLHVTRDRNPVFVRLHDGAVRNGYTLKVANRSFQREQMTITLKGQPAAVLKMPGSSETAKAITVEVPANEVRAVRVFVTLPPQALTAPNLPATFVVRSSREEAATATTFLSGAANSQ
jgi:polyferredoxin